VAERKAGHRLTILTGNHDIELNPAAVRRKLREAIGVQPGHDFEFIGNGEAYPVGDASIEHGNLYDAWNVVDDQGFAARRGAASYAVSMQVTIPEEALPAKIILNPELHMDDDAWFAFCQASPDVRFERTAEGEIVIVPPAGWDSDYQTLGVASELRKWAIRDGRGKASGPSTEFMLETGAAFSPDAAWVSNAKLAQFTKAQRRKFLRVCPEFIVEVMSPSDRLKAAQDKMREWMRAGVELGWLIHGDKRTVYIYRAGQEPEARSGILQLSGEGPVAGFELELTHIWDEPATAL